MNNRGIIVLDPGHGQFGNKHTTRDGFYEGTQNFILASFLKAELEALGFEIKMSTKLSHARGATQNGQVMVERSDRMWSSGEGNGKSLQYSCLENQIGRAHV